LAIWRRAFSFEDDLAVETGGIDYARPFCADVGGQFFFIACVFWLRKRL
jgi:hypothetical protein